MREMSASCRILHDPVVFDTINLGWLHMYESLCAWLTDDQACMRSYLGSTMYALILIVSE
jgi:hypothetical protein